MLWPFVRGEMAAEVGDGRVRCRLGVIGRFDLPVEQVDRLAKMRWPWWGGLGARMGFKLVAFTAATGNLALLELSAPADVKAPLRWRASRIAVGVDDVDGFLRAVAHERARVTAEQLDAQATFADDDGAPGTSPSAASR